MNNEHSRRGGSHTIEQLDAEVEGRKAATDGKPRSANPYSADKVGRGPYWDFGHCAMLGVDPAAPIKTDPVQAPESIPVAEPVKTGDQTKR